MKEDRTTWINIHNAALQPLLLDELKERAIFADILRLDKIHPVVSGNKWFKLKYYLQDAIRNDYKAVLSFGGAWSNHIIATAFAAHQSGINSIGVIRGERPKQLSDTLKAAKAYGMQLEFISRLAYTEKENEHFINGLRQKFGNIFIIPEGGAGEKGIQGSKEILSLAEPTNYSHIVCCIGTGTMYTGLALSSLLTQEIIGIPVLKRLEKQESKLGESIQPSEKLAYCKIIHDYHFGGYARKTSELLRFMNHFYELTGIPTDFVYTGKLLYACFDLFKKNYFPSGSKILIIHSGGLQGNSSLPDKALLF